MIARRWGVRIWLDLQLTHAKFLIDLGMPNGNPWQGHMAPIHWSTSTKHEPIRYVQKPTNQNLPCSNLSLGGTLQSHLANSAIQNLRSLPFSILVVSINYHHKITWAYGVELRLNEHCWIHNDKHFYLAMVSKLSNNIHFWVENWLPDHIQLL